MGCLGECAAGCVKKVFIAITSLLKVCVAVAIVAIVAIKLQDLDVNFNNNAFNSHATCLLGKDAGGRSLCIYAYVVCGVSLAASFVLSLFLCFTCDLCGLGNWLELIFAAAGTVWWVIASLIFSKYGSDANNRDLPNDDWRNAVLVLSWVAVALFGFATLLYLVDAFQCLRKCVCCCCDDSDDRPHGRV